MQEREKRKRGSEKGESKRENWRGGKLRGSEKGEKGREKRGRSGRKEGMEMENKGERRKVAEKV